MGAAAYYRGSKAISESIQRDYEELNRRARNIETLERLEKKINKLNEFSTNAQALFSDSTNIETAKGLLKSSIYESWNKKKDTKRVKNMLDECCKAHNEWVDANILDSLQFKRVCHRKAKAWYTLLEALNKGFEYHFKVPSL